MNTSPFVEIRDTSHLGLGKARVKDYDNKVLTEPEPRWFR